MTSVVKREEERKQGISNFDAKFNFYTGTNKPNQTHERITDVHGRDILN